MEGLDAPPARRVGTAWAYTSRVVLLRAWPRIAATVGTSTAARQHRRGGGVAQVMEAD